MDSVVIDKQKLKNVLIFLGVFVVASILVYFLVVNPLLGDKAEGLNYKVSLDIKTTVSDTFTLYYDNLEATRFDEAHKKTVSVKGSPSYQTVSFEIPAEGVSYLKFNLATQNNVTFNIRSITIESFSRVKKYNFDRLSTTFDLVEKMSRFSDKDGYISTKATKLGSYFTNSEPLGETYGKPTLPLVSASVTFTIMCGVLLILRLVKSGDKKWYLTPEFILFALFAIALIAVLVAGLFISPLTSATADYLVKSLLALIIFAVCAIIAVIRFKKSSEKHAVGDILTVVCLGAVICLPLVASVFFVPKVSDEYTAPDFTLSRFMEYPAEATAQYEQQFPVNTLLSASYADVKTFLFADSQYDDVVIGKNNWLFNAEELPDYKKTNTFSKESLVKIRDTLLNYERTFKGQNIAFYILIVPNKSTVYSNMMPSSVRRTAREDRLTQVYDYLWKYSDMNVVEIRDRLIAASYDNDVYFRTDNYLNSNGAFTAVNSVLAKIAANIDTVEALDPEDYNIEPVETQMKSLAILMEYGDSFREYDYSYAKSRKSKLVTTSAVNSPFMNLEEGETVKMPDITALFGEGAIAELTATDKLLLTDNYVNMKNPDALNDLHAVIVHDETLLTSMPFFGEAFKETSFILNNGDWTTRSIVSEAPDLVIFEISEQYLANLVK